mgnify:CR=1 FL=1
MEKKRNDVKIGSSSLTNAKGEIDQVKFHDHIKAKKKSKKMQDEGGEGSSHMHIDVKSADGNTYIKDHCTRFEDLPYNEFKKRIAFRKEYWPDVHYELIYFSN